MRNGFKFLKQVESKTNQFEIVSTLKYTIWSEAKVLNCYLLYKLKKFGDKSRNSLATNETLNFSSPCSKVRPAKLTNHAQRAY